jgi:hypothetical protein
MLRFKNYIKSFFCIYHSKVNQVHKIKFLPRNRVPYLGMFGVPEEENLHLAPVAWAECFCPFKKNLSYGPFAVLHLAGPKVGRDQELAPVFRRQKVP